MPQQRDAPVANRLRAALSPSRPLGAYQLTQILGQEMQRRSYANTVYRVLATLVATGEAIQLVSVKAWLRATSDKPAAVVLLCRRCQRAQQLNADDVRAQLQRICTQHGFASSRSFAEVNGLCDRCAVV